MLDIGCNNVRSKLNPAILKKLDPSVGSSGRLRNIVKSVLLIGANLSQTREYRDLFEDLVTKIAEPLEECGILPLDMPSIIAACFYVVSDIPDSNRQSIMRSSTVDSSLRAESTTIANTPSATTVSRATTRTDQLKRDWLRFITFCRLCLSQLCSYDRRM